MRKILLFLFIVFCSVISGCSYKPSVSDDVVPGAKIKLVYQEGDQSLVFDSIATRCGHFIPETTENSLLGSIHRVVKCDSLYFMFDDLKQVMAFTETGKHQFTIHNIGEGPGEYITLSDIAIDYTRKKLVLLVDQKILYYNLDGTFTGHETRLPDYAHEIIVSGQTEFLTLSTYTNNELSRNSIRTINQNDGTSFDYMKPLREYAPYCFFLGSYLTSSVDGTVYFTRKFDSNIYTLHEDSYSIEYQIDWGEWEFIPKEDVQYDCSDIFKEGLMDKKVYAVYDFQRGDSIITFRTNYPGFYYGSLNTRSIYYILQPIDGEFNLPLVNAMPVGGTDGMIMFDLSQFYLEKQLESIPTYGNEKFREVFDSMSKDSNPLLIFYKLK